MIRDATGDDVATVVELWREFEAEAPEPAWRDDEAEIRQRELERAIATDIVLLAEQDARPIGLAVADTKSERVGFLHILYVRPRARQLGVAAALVRATVDRLRAKGRDMLELEVLASNEPARFRRASLSNEGDRASLLAHPDALDSPLARSRRAESVSLPSRIESSASRPWSRQISPVNWTTFSSTRTAGGAALPPRSCSTPSTVQQINS
jgi:GNAT superfamily N-acetyltransferase